MASHSLSRRRALASGASVAILLGVASVLAACSSGSTGSAPSAPAASSDLPTPSSAIGESEATMGSAPAEVEGYEFTPGTLTDRGFVVDHRLSTPGERELHFSLSLPEGFDPSTPAPLYVALPGWEGLYFQGVGVHLVEDMPFTARERIPELIIASPQLDDWGETSALDTIELTRWLIAAYNVDPTRVLLSVALS